MPHSDTELYDWLLHNPFRGWTLREKLGEGASAWVFLAEKDGEQCALKVFKRWLTEKYPPAVQEARIRRQLALRGIKHPHLVPVLDGGRDETTGLYFLFMKYLPWSTLSKNRSRIPVHRIAPLLAQVASAAQFLEENGFVHRDIKPDNILVDDQWRTATLLDFGVLRPLAGSTVTDQHSDQRAFLGTTRWSPPEFLTRSEEPDQDGYRAITFYQLGAVLHDLLVGKEMFWMVPAEPPARLVQAVLGRPPDFSQVREGASSELVALAQVCLAKEPADRLRSVTWESFSSRRLRRRPVVVLLYTGGTIGARVAADSSHTRDLRPVLDSSEDFLRAFRDKVRRDYALFCGPTSPMPFDLEWEVLPVDQQLLSENADSQTWQNLATAIQRICAKYVPSSAATLPDSSPAHAGEATYLAGIVVLHGTDTLAYSAASLTVALQNLPCAVVLTGSNQPPNVHDASELNPLTSRSDAWKNVRRSLLFLQTFGHRFTEVYVCFGDTVHSAINLRKIYARRQPMLRKWEDVPLLEPYAYRNQGMQRDYMFRVVEELYCNNFYPLSDRLGYQGLLKERITNTYRHFRSSPQQADRQLQVFTFSPRVRLAVVSPVFFGEVGSATSDSLAESLDQVDVLVLEGYNSGTFPTEAGHPFAAVLRRLMERAIPIVLVARHGLLPTNEPYRMQEIDGKKIPVLRLFGVVAETAAPLISVIRSSIPDVEWAAVGETNAYERLEKRRNLLESALRKRQDESPGILTALLGNVVDEVEQLRRMGEGIESEWNQYSLMVERLFRPAEDPLSARLASDRWRRARGRAQSPTAADPSGGDKRSTAGDGTKNDRRFDDARSVLMRGHFLWLLREFVRPFEVGGCGPDGLGALNEMGFVWGQQMFDRLKAPGHEGGIRRLSEADTEQRASMVERVREKVARLSRLLHRHGVADLKTVLKVEGITRTLGGGTPAVRLNVSSARHGFIGRPDELYAVKDYGEEEKSFFDALRNGAALTLYDNECVPDLERRFRLLAQGEFGPQLSALDWFLVGVFKAVTCSVLVELKFDDWVADCTPSYKRSPTPLRQSVQTQILAADEAGWKMLFSYDSRGEERAADLDDSIGSAAALARLKAS